MSAELFNTGGQLLLKKIVRGNNSFDLSNCSPGIYIIRVRKENKFFKVTKQ
ncbi:MAG: T9SS type A sorting domain-containing protein [Chitinophagaceae bacterium]|nr:T9SS type A sorting domain-containing protein [Chitinophagaceae bacterium]